MPYVDSYNRSRYIDPYPSAPDRLPIVTSVTPPVIAHVRVFAYIVATVVLALAS